MFCLILQLFYKKIHLLKEQSIPTFFVSIAEKSIVWIELKYMN